MPGKFVALKDTLASFKSIMDGEMDSVSETSFYMVGGHDDVIEKSKKLARDAEEMRKRMLEREKLEAERKAAQVKA